MLTWTDIKNEINKGSKKKRSMRGRKKNKQNMKP
jgi:hypothetical protein